MLVAYDETLTAHLAGVSHPEHPDRVRIAAAELARRDLLGERIATRAATIAELERIHPAAYIERARRECERLAAGEVAMLSTGDTAIDAGTFDGAAHAAGGALAALERVAAENRAAFALVRPPGHHAEPARGMGYCVFNNAALAAHTYAGATGGRVLVADFDYHHGNGTQSLVGNGVSFVSTHADPAYPGTGSSADNHFTRNGTLVNIPILASGIATEAFIAIWSQALHLLVRRLQPALLVVSAGYDFVAGDPVGDLGVDPSIARELGRLVREIADEYCGGRALFVLEGGYDPATLAQCVAETIAGYDEARVADAGDATSIPAAQRRILAAAAA